MEDELKTLVLSWRKRISWWRMLAMDKLKISRLK